MAYIKFNLNKKSGIYCLYSKKTGKYYIGKSNNLTSRHSGHFWALKNNRHDSRKLQNHVNKYGVDDLEFHVIMLAPIQDLIAYEKFFIQCYDSVKNGLNMSYGGENPPVKTRPPFRVQNADTGEIYKGSVVKDFCEKYNLGDSSPTCAMLKGKINFTKGWFNLDAEWRPVYYTVISPEGKSYTFWRIWDFAKEHGLSGHWLTMLVTYQANSHHGWKRPDSVENAYSGQQNSAKNYIVRGPDGKIHKFKNLKIFCEQNNLSYSWFCTQKRTKGWEILSCY